MNPPALPLIGAGLDWLEGLLPLLFLLFWIVSQIRGLFRGAAQRPPVVVPPRPRPAADDAQQEMRRQIAEFLRTAGRPPESPAEQARRRKAGPRRAAERGSATPPRPPAAAVPPPIAGRKVGGLEGHSGDVARHVNDAFAQQLGHLGHLEAGLAKAARPAPSAAPRRTAAAAEIATLLRSPATVRQLVLMREILDRPEHRW